MGTLHMSGAGWIISNTFTSGTGGTIDIDADEARTRLAEADGVVVRVVGPLE